MAVVVTDALRVLLASWEVGGESFPQTSVACLCDLLARIVISVITVLSVVCYASASVVRGRHALYCCAFILRKEGVMRSAARCKAVMLGRGEVVACHCVFSRL